MLMIWVIFFHLREKFHSKTGMSGLDRRSVPVLVGTEWKIRTKDWVKTPNEKSVRHTVPGRVNYEPMVQTSVLYNSTRTSEITHFLTIEQKLWMLYYQKKYRKIISYL